MSQIRVLTIDSVSPILRIGANQSWTTKPVTEIDKYDSNFEKFYKQIERNHTANEMTKEIEEESSWLEENQERGELGEKLALTYLQSQFQNVQSVSHIASKGYDIEVLCEKTNNIIGYEVKTSLTVNKFHITYNELLKAYKMKENYNLFFIYLEEKVETSYGILINNPIQSLNLDFLTLTEPIRTGKAEVIPNQFRIHMSHDYLETLEVIYL